MVKKENISKIFKKMMMVSTRLKLDMLRETLEMDRELFNKKIFDWAMEFDFTIDGDYLVVNKDTISDFIDALDQ